MSKVDPGTRGELRPGYSMPEVPERDSEMLLETNRALIASMLRSVSSTRKSERRTINVEEVVRCISRELNAARGSEKPAVFVHPDARDALRAAGMMEDGPWFMGVALLARDDTKPDEPEAVNKWDVVEYLESLADASFPEEE
jgi:hypothetical protein